MSGGPDSRSPLPSWFIGECLGTGLLVFCGCGSVALAVLTGAHISLFQVAVIWGLGVATASYLAGNLSGAHLNPAVTFAFAAWTDFPWAKAPRYLVAQLLGALLGCVTLFAVFHGVLDAYEVAHHIVRGAPGSEATAMIFGEYFPNPGGQSLTDAARATVSPGTAFFIETLGTAILVVVILGSIDESDGPRPQILPAATIGLTITLLVSLLWPLTMAGFNPARDLAARLFSALAGWREVPFTTNGNDWLTVYVLAPLLGGWIGGGLYRWWLAPNYAPR